VDVSVVAQERGSGPNKELDVGGNQYIFFRNRFNPANVRSVVSVAKLFILRRQGGCPQQAFLAR